MAFVYKAMDTQLERFVTIKTLKPNYVNQETFVERFRKEAKTAANLNHPNIVQILIGVSKKNLSLLWST